MKASNKRLCCCIPNQMKIGERCQNLAEYEIWMGDNPTPDDFTDSCGKHLEQMLDDSSRFVIFRISANNVNEN